MTGLPVQSHADPDSQRGPDGKPDHETDEARDVRHLVPGPCAFENRKADEHAKDETNQQTDDETDDEPHDLVLSFLRLITRDRHRFELEIDLAVFVRHERVLEPILVVASLIIFARVRAA